MTSFKFPLKDYVNKQNDCVGLLATHLNEGSLSLLLGAGASAGFGLPAWNELVVGCAQESIPGFVPKLHLNDYTNDELKILMDDVKREKPHEYIEIIKRQLYIKGPFDFTNASKDLLIAVTSLLIGRTRGNVKGILNYNFDSVLEWYLRFNGLKANVTTFENLIQNSGDVDILHIHGYVPHSIGFGVGSGEVVFSKKEFEDRQVGDTYWKEMMYEFFRRSVFLSLGLSSESIVNDICPYLRESLSWHKKNDIKRLNPFGFAFVTRAEPNQINDMLEAGVIPCVLTIPQIPPAVFEISQRAMNL